jgi:hypothetical protein
MDPIPESRFLLDASLQSFIGPDLRLWVTYERPLTRAGERGLLRHLDDLVSALVRRGVRLICGPRQITDRAATQKSFKLTPDRAIFVETLDGPHSYLDKVLYLPRVPTLLLLGHEESDVLPAGWTLPPEGFPLVLVVPSDTEIGPTRIPFQELCHPIVRSDVLLRRL